MAHQVEHETHGVTISAAQPGVKLAPLPPQTSWSSTGRRPVALAARCFIWLDPPETQGQIVLPAEYRP
jgi:hypothetical protein